MSNPLGPTSGRIVNALYIGVFFGIPLVLVLLLLVVVLCSDYPLNIEPPSTPPNPVPLPHIRPDAPLADLLPTPPSTGSAPIYVGDDLTAVPELSIEDVPQLPAEQWEKRKAHAIAAALALNQREEDGFLKAVLRGRPDLAGLPFAMGKACRTCGEEAQALKSAAAAVRRTKDAALVSDSDLSDRAHLAVISQVIPGEGVKDQQTLVRSLAAIPRPEATRSLASLAVFGDGPAVRNAAIQALAIRREEGAAEPLIAGLNYPWPGVAENAATAIVKLKRKDLIPHLKKAVEAPDPRGPRTEVVTGGRKETVAPEIVRINHHANCLLCHAPAERGKAPDEALVAEVPVPTEPLSTLRDRYYQPDSNLLVRVDVTYLRQDFSAQLTVSDWTSQTWGDKQRFDFFVRRRVLTDGEADDLRRRLAAAPSPYRQAAEKALKELGER